MRRLRLPFAIVALVLGGCTDPVASLGDLAPGTTESGGNGDEPFLLATSPPRGVDILVVLDNTAAMAAHQAALASALGTMVEGLAAINDVRISFTTTDHANPWCVGTSPEAGKLGVTSCQERLASFVGGEQVGCLDVCDVPGFSITPTTTADDPEPKIRPWIESIAAVSNVSTDLRRAVTCAAPQGIDGCPFPQPLESIAAALDRSSQSGALAQGFVRPDAALAIVVVTDGVDCSYDPAAQEIFSADGNQVFWSNPDEAVPTAAVCWNAGVSCSGGDADSWGQCIATDKSLSGAATTSSEAVLFPLSRYFGRLTDVAAAKSPYLTDPPIAVYVVGGVPSGYVAGATPPSYPRTGDPSYLREHGVGPACGSAPDGPVPLVRLRELVESNGELVEGRVASLCDGDFATALSGLGGAGQPNLDPLCYPECAADLDGASGGLQPQCEVTLEQGSASGRIDVDVPACGGVPSAPQIPDGSEVCWYARNDRVGSTPDPSDDVAQACLDAGTNLEIQIVRAGGTLEPGGTSVFAWCEPDPGCP